MKISKHIWHLNLINPIIIYWVWTSFYWTNQPHIFLYHWQMWQINPLSRVSLGRTARVTPIYKDDGDINDENNYRLISVTDILHRGIDDWLENVYDCAITGACRLEISKWFDSINHTTRLKKLEMYVITSTELRWFSSYLRGRKQVVKFHQETIPDPILFWLFINGISNFAVEACVLNMYADDIIFYTSAHQRMN